MRHSSARIAVRNEVSPSRTIKVRRNPKPVYRPAPPRFRVVELTRSPGGFSVVDGFNCEVGNFITRRGAERSALRLNAAVARSLLAPPRPVAECVGADHPHSAEISSPSFDDDYLPSVADYAAYLDMLAGDEPADDHDAFEEQELSEFRRRRPDLAHIDVYA